MKKIVYGIAVILFGFMCYEVSLPTDIGVLCLLGMLLGLCGIILATIGFFDE